MIDLNNIMKKLCVFLFVLLIVLCAVLAVLIVRNDDAQTVSTESKFYEKISYRQYEPIEPNVKLLGRSSYSDGKMIFSHSGSGLEFLCKGAYAEITICSVGTFSFSRTHLPRFAIYADGNLIVDECVGYTEKTYRIDTSYEGTVITVVKLSEAMYSSFGISNIASYGMENITPTAEKELKIEFIGDSITCGYGIDEGPYGSFSTETENFSKSYAYLTAKNLDADYSAICFSGYGVVSGYTETGYKTDKLVMNEYDKACIISDSEFLWDFSKNANDLVVVNLGTNDASYCGDSYNGRLEFIAAYINLIKTVREKNPSAYILCILGDMNNTLFSSIESAVNQYTSETWDSKVEAFTISYKMGENDVVIDGHPGEESNRCASVSLTEKIRNLIQQGKVGN